LIDRRQDVNERRTRELRETYQAIDETGKVYTIQVYVDVVHTTKLDGTTAREERMKSHKTLEGHHVNVNPDGSLEDIHDRIRMRRIESP
jgi:hypothetical protein